MKQKETTIYKANNTGEHFILMKDKESKVVLLNVDEEETVKIEITKEFLKKNFTVILPTIFINEPRDGSKEVPMVGIDNRIMTKDKYITIYN